MPYRYNPFTGEFDYFEPAGVPGLHAPTHQAGGADDLESLLRLANFAERAHGSLTGVGASDHHIKTTSLADITDHDLAHHPLAIIPSMDWAHISGIFPRTIADLLSDHDLAHHPLAIIPTLDDAHIPNLETLSYGGPFANAQIPTPLKDKVLSLGLTAGAAITANQVVYVSAPNKVSPAAVAHRSKVIGVALNDAAVDEAVEVCVFGKTTVVADGAIGIGELVAAAPTAGRVVSLTSIIPTFVGNALAAHGHTFTGSAMGTHNHTFSGSALPTHNHTFTGSAMSGHSHTVNSHRHSIGKSTTTVASSGHTHGGTTGGHNSSTMYGWIATYLSYGFYSKTSGGSPTTEFYPIETAGGPQHYLYGSHTHGFTTGGPSATTTVVSSVNSYTGYLSPGTNSVSAGTPSGSINSVSAGTPSGSISSTSAGTPSGSVSDTSAGVPSGSVSAIPLGQTIGRAITAAAGAGSSLTIVVVPGG